MRRITPLLALLLLALALLLAACDGESIGALRQSIVNGQPYSGHPSVGKLLIGSQGGYCTATLIGKKTVLTAGHCIEPGSSYKFQIGGSTYSVASALCHPQYNENVVNSGGATAANDIAVVILAQAPSVTPAAVATSAPPIGLPVTLVGYGTTGENAQDDGRRMGKTTVGWVNTTEIGWKGSSTTSTTCYGDSGGPSFGTINGQEVQVSVCSRSTGICGVDDIETRVDAYLDWIVSNSNGDVNKGTSTTTDQQAPKVAITSPADGATVTSPFNVEATVSDDVGVVKAELAEKGVVATTLTSAPWQFQVSLGPGKHLLAVSGLDAAGNRGVARVTVTVTGGAAPSPDAGATAPTTRTPSLAGFGEACQANADCTSGICAQSGGVTFCTESCSSTSCPSGTSCVSAGTTKLCTRPGTTGNAADETSGGFGCSAGPAGAGPAASLPLPLLLLIGLGLGGRRAARQGRRARVRASRP